MKVVVVGGSGFIGTRLLTELQERGHEVANVDLVPSAAHPAVTALGDVRDEAAMTAALTGADAVVNLAAEHRDDVRPLSRYASTNVDGARALAAAASAAGVPRVLFTSTVAVYGLGRPRPTEDDPTLPFNEYGRTKLAAEEVLRGWAAQDPARSLFVVRPCVVFGEGNRGNVWTLATQVASGRFLMIGDGSNRKSMAYVGNVAAFLAGGLDAGPGTHLTNYADRPDLTTRQLTDLLQDELGVTSRRRPLPVRAGLVAGAAADVVARVTRRPLPVSRVRVEKFVAETTVGTARLEASGFAPPYALEDALRRTVRAEFPERVRPA